ncbi:hypothetical protein ACV07N_01730 [Roseivirga echinicomitans]
MKKKIFGVIGVMMIVASMILPQTANAVCKSCGGIESDGWCVDRECQVLFIEGWACNVDISQHHNGDCSEAHTE